MSDFTTVIIACFVGLGIVYALTLLILSIWLCLAAITARRAHKRLTKAIQHVMEQKKR